MLAEVLYCKWQLQSIIQCSITTLCTMIHVMNLDVFLPLCRSAAHPWHLLRVDPKIAFASVTAHQSQESASEMYDNMLNSSLVN